MDAPRGFEPRLTESESVVLPLDDRAIAAPLPLGRGLQGHLGRALRTVNAEPLELASVLEKALVPSSGQPDGIARPVQHLDEQRDGVASSQRADAGNAGRAPRQRAPS